ncbi:hypothetical protein MHYP_G00022670 [Metynnis hypsauchen]
MKHGIIGACAEEARSPFTGPSVELRRAEEEVTVSTALCCCGPKTVLSQQANRRAGKLFYCESHMHS